MATSLRAFIGLVTLAVIAQTALGDNYIVGGAGGWNLGADFDTWALSQSFKPGDTLIFTYGALHSVVEVTKADYDACSTNIPIASFTDGNSVVKLSSPGKRYFICGAAGHCSGGMKMEINTVSAAANAPSPAALRTPPADAPPTKLSEAPAAAPSLDAPAIPSPADLRTPPAPAPPTKLSEAPAAAPSLDAPSTGDSSSSAPAMTPSTSPSVVQASDQPSTAPLLKPSSANSVVPLTKIGLGLATTTLMALMI